MIKWRNEKTRRVHFDEYIHRSTFPTELVGSGIAEAACKTPVSTGAKCSGMRWAPEGLDAVLALRTGDLNGIYDDFWEEHPRVVA